MNHEIANRAHPTRSVLREFDLAIPAWVPLRWPFEVWAVCIHVQWFYGIARGAEAPAAELERAAAAVDWLSEAARGGRSVAAVTHGAFRRLLSSTLLNQGWTTEPGHRTYGHWSAWGFQSENCVSSCASM